jgi:hypothetical protein
MYSVQNQIYKYRQTQMNCLNGMTDESTSQSQSHVTTEDKSVSKSWFQGPFGSHDRTLISVDIYSFTDIGRPL